MGDTLGPAVTLIRPDVAPVTAAKEKNWAGQSPRFDRQSISKRDTPRKRK